MSNGKRNGRSHTTDDRALRSVFRTETGGSSTSGQNNDGTGILLDRSRNGSESQGLGGVGRSRSQLPHLVEERRVTDGRLGEESGLGHHSDSLQGVRSLGSLSGKHDTVSTVEDGVGDVGNLGTGRSGVVLDEREYFQRRITRLLTGMFQYSQSWTPTFGWHRLKAFRRSNTWRSSSSGP